MKNDRDDVGGNRSYGPTIARLFRDFWHRLVKPIAALPRDSQPTPVRVTIKTRDRNHPRQRY
ncbi:hypothetical protein CO674_25635 [Rhizobium hidalgonense]|uniref:Uncharacterized protein n=1 Tax=Rhizobium hidalgonense TaxID=1538159 RepID=A0ABX4JM92_9HYPH|nr:hypothetical protein CO674_25635 [Rhizobium hidalgonense]RWX06272.1 hypothetical protein EHI42_31730 [Rhizobium hidalgonense]